jgi:hypothetical protein
MFIYIYIFLQKGELHNIHILFSLKFMCVFELPELVQKANFLLISEVG